MNESGAPSKGSRRSYFWTMLFVLPVFGVSNLVARSEEMIAGIAQFTSLILAGFIIVWTVRRLKDAGKSAWWAIALIPPATIFLLAYCFLSPSSRQNATDSGVYVYGIRAQGFWRISVIVFITLLLAYLGSLFAIFLSDGL